MARLILERMAVLLVAPCAAQALDPVRQAGAVAILPKPFSQEQVN